MSTSKAKKNRYFLPSGHSQKERKGGRGRRGDGKRRDIQYLLSFYKLKCLFLSFWSFLIIFVHISSLSIFLCFCFFFLSRRSHSSLAKKKTSKIKKKKKILSLHRTSSFFARMLCVLLLLLFFLGVKFFCFFGLPPLIPIFFFFLALSLFMASAGATLQKERKEKRKVGSG